MPPESYRVREFLGTMSFDKRSMMVQFFMSSEAGEPGQTRTEVVKR